MNLAVLQLDCRRVVGVGLAPQRNEQLAAVGAMRCRQSRLHFTAALLLDRKYRPDARLRRHRQRKELTRRVLDLIADGGN